MKRNRTAGKRRTARRETRAAARRLVPSAARPVSPAAPGSIEGQSALQPPGPLSDAGPDTPAPPGNGGTPAGSGGDSAGGAVAGLIQAAPGEVERAIRTAEEAVKNPGAARQFVTQDEFDRLLEAVSQLTLLQGSPFEAAASPRLEALERRVAELAQQFRNNRNSGPGG